MASRAHYKKQIGIDISKYVYCIRYFCLDRDSQYVRCVRRVPTIEYSYA